MLVEAQILLANRITQTVRFDWAVADPMRDATLSTLCKVLCAYASTHSSSMRAMGDKTFRCALFVQKQQNRWDCLRSDYELRDAINSVQGGQKLKLRAEGQKMDVTLDFWETSQSGRLLNHAETATASKTLTRPQSSPLMRPKTSQPEKPPRVAWKDESPNRPQLRATIQKRDASPLSRKTNPRCVPPPKTDLYVPRLPKSTIFQKHYKLGEIPARVSFAKNPSGLDWSTEIKDLNYQYFAPIFFAGIMEQDDPFCTIARRGSLMLIQHEDSVPKLLALVSTITEKVLDAIHTRHPPTMAWGLYLFNNLSERDPQLAQALSRFYKHLTPLFRMYLDKYVPVDESYEAKKKMELNFNEVLRTTIEIMIRTQGQDAILLIKRAAPTFHYV